MKNKKKGFTLVELIVVLAILAILAAMLVPALTGYIDKANEKKIVATARQYYIAAQTVVSDAYAAGDELKTISVANDGTVTITATKTLDTNKDTKYKADYKSLAEYKNGSEDTITFTITDKKITSGTVVSGGKTATLSGDAWFVS